MALPNNVSLAPKRGIWYLYYYQEAKRRGVSLRTRQRKEALNRAERFLQELDDTNGEQLSKVLTDWLTWSETLSRKYKQDAANAWNRLVDYFDDKPITMLSAPDIVEYLNNLKASGLSNTSINIYGRAIRAICNWALVQGKIKRNLFKNVRIPKAEMRDKYLELDEIKRLLDAARSRPLYRAFIRFLLATGARRGEFYNLRWSDINGDTIKFAGKTGIRFFPMQTHILEILKEIKGLQHTEAIYVFSSRKGERFQEANRIGRIVRRYADKADLDKSYSTHTLRHTFCSHLVIQGISIYEVCKLAGHTNVRTTERYAHLSPERLNVRIDYIGSA
jgi:integrase